MFDRWWYYLHTSGTMHPKRYRPDPSDFVVKIWEVSAGRGGLMTMLKEALSLGADDDEIIRIAKRNNVTAEDFFQYIVRYEPKSESDRIALSDLSEVILGVRFFRLAEWWADNHIGKKLSELDGVDFSTAPQPVWGK